MSDRNVQRINGEIEHLHLLSNDELDNHYQYAQQRRNSANHDMDIVADEIHRRSNAELPLGEVALGAYAEVADSLITGQGR
jgi:hypothetical protein